MAEGCGEAQLPRNPFSACGGRNPPALSGRTSTAGGKEQFVEGAALHTSLKNIAVPGYLSTATVRKNAARCVVTGTPDTPGFTT